MKQEYIDTLNAIDRYEKLSKLYEQDFFHFVGSIALNIEIIANETVVASVVKENPALEFELMSDSALIIEESKDRIADSLKKGIESKTQSVLADYAAQKARQDLLNL